MACLPKLRSEFYAKGENRMTRHYVLRKPSGVGKHYTHSLLEHLRYSGDRVLGWREKDNCFDVLLESSIFRAHGRQIKRAKSFGFQYMKVSDHMTQFSPHFEFRTSASTVSEVSK